MGSKCGGVILPGGCHSRRDWAQIYAVYGVGPHGNTAALLLLHAFLSAFLSALLLLYFAPALSLLAAAVPLPVPALRFLLGFSGSVAAISSACLASAAANFLHSSLGLHWDMCQRVVAAVPDWSSVRAALDVGCGRGRGILLNSVALQLKKQGARGGVVGLLPRRDAAVAALRTACAEGVQEYVTCREGDARRLPFADAFFDVVVSAVHLSGVGRGDAGERGRGVGEVVRVLRPGGVGVVWDVGCVPEYVERLREMRMDDIAVSPAVTAYMLTSHIVSFRKPLHYYSQPQSHYYHQQQQQQQQQAVINMANTVT